MIDSDATLVSTGDTAI